jgi:hypothetical protein
MRPVYQVILAFLLFGLMALSYSLIKGIDSLDASIKIRHETSFAHAIQSACLAYMTEYNRLPPISDNHTLTAALLGDNSRHLTFIFLSKDELNANNEMIDLWRTPLKITSQGASGIQITSAGPDKVFGTADDIVTNNAAKN